MAYLRFKSCAPGLTMMKRFALLLAFLTVTTAAKSSSCGFWSAAPSSFVPPAPPTLARSEPFAPIQILAARHAAIAAGYGTFSNAPMTTALWARKKGGAAKKSGGGSKIQVKLLKPVAGTGQPGDVVQVTSAFFQNKLRPTQSAKLISKEEVQAEAAKKEAKEEATLSTANVLKDQISDISLTITRKAGPEGHLFGGVGPKCIMDELQKQLKDDFLKGKGVKIVSVTDQDGKKLSHDIKELGEFQATISLTHDITTKFTVSVTPES